MNSEFRFPLIDVIATPFLVITGVRGHIFLDVGGAWLKDQPFQFWDADNKQLKDGIASYGAGFSLYFLGLPWNVDFARQWRVPGADSKFTTQFYVGYTF